MNIAELKKSIEDKNINNEPLIFSCLSGEDFLPFQYIDQIAQIKNASIIMLEEDVNRFDFDNSLLNNNYLYVLQTKELSANIYPENKNVIVVCNNIKKGTVVKDVSIVDFGGLESWQIHDYLKMRVPGLKEEEINWLIDVSKKNIYRLKTECDKISIFRTENQESIFNQLNDEGAYIDLNNLSIFNLINYIMNKDVSLTIDFLSQIEYIDVEPTGLVTLLIQHFRRLIDVQFYPNLKLEQSNMNYKQFMSAKQSCNKYTNEQLISIYEFLTSIDYKLKSGNLDISRGAFIDYVICNILSI